MVASGEEKIEKDRNLKGVEKKHDPFDSFAMWEQTNNGKANSKKEKESKV